ncbi:MAG: methionine--tRNA ligase, partial [Myxococcales bacterium]|nr:methionine--tRNA ligase [Myxococcales bacterium]
MSNRVLVTAALPYANGSIHLGHLLEAVQTDVYVRARKMAGDDVIFMWAADTHGTPIELRARREGITPEALIERAHADHLAVFQGFGIGFDIYYTTHSDETKAHAERIFKAIEAGGGIASRETHQLYCPHDQMFLPDRFVKGTCPKCGATDQYGDVCERCGATYDPTDLKDAACSLCGTKPELAASEHLFVPLAKHEAWLRSWLRPIEEGGETHLQPTVRNYVQGWVDQGLRDWDISRDAPYFGFEIPGHPGKYFYVWFDAPIGYIGATQRYCDQTGADFGAYWQSGDAEIVHVIGKDIVYFHCLFWPAMLHAAGYTTPSRVQVHGWLQVNGEKMSKTRGTFILGRTYLDHASPDYLRYYFAARLGAEQGDIDLSMEDFANRVNADLVKKAANLASRAIKFVGSRLDGKVGVAADDAAPLLARARERLAEAPGLYREFESGRALRLAMEIAEDFNLYLTEAAPWKLVKSDPERARAVCTAVIEACVMIAAILKPVLPGWAEKVERMLRLQPLTFANAGASLAAGLAIGEYETLAEPLDPAKLEAIIEASKESAPVAPAAEDAPAYEVEPLQPEVAIDAFVGLDLRVARVVAAAAVEGSNKLLHLTLDLGPLGSRSVFSGIAKSYAPEAL